MADTAEHGTPGHQQPGGGNGSENHPLPGAPGATEHLNIKVTDNNNEVFFKIKRTTKLEKLMTAFCERQGKTLASVRFLFEGQRVQPTDTPDTVSPPLATIARCSLVFARSGLFQRKPLTSHLSHSFLQLEMQDGDTLEVHQEQVGGC